MLYRSEEIIDRFHRWNMSKNPRKKERTSFNNSRTQSKSDIKKKKITRWFRDQDDGKEVEKASELALVDVVGAPLPLILPHL